MLKDETSETTRVIENTRNAALSDVQSRVVASMVLVYSCIYMLILLFSYLLLGVQLGAFFG